MTISRPAPRRWPIAVAAAVLGAIVGLLIGLALGGDDSSDPADAWRETSSKLTQAASLLEVATVEYKEAVRNGKVVRPPEYRGARGAVARSRELYFEARGALGLLDTALVARIDDAYGGLAAALAERAPAVEFERLAEHARTVMAPA